MTDSMSELADRFKKAKFAEAQTQDDSRISDIDRAIQERINNTLPDPEPPTDTTPPPSAIDLTETPEEQQGSGDPSLKDKAPRKKTPQTQEGVGAVNVLLTIDLASASTEAASNHDVWDVEYVRSAVTTYVDSITPVVQRRNRRTRNAQHGVNRNYRLGAETKGLLERNAKRTNLSQSDLVRECLRIALSDDAFVPVIS